MYHNVYYNSFLITN